MNPTSPRTELSVVASTAEIQKNFTAAMEHLDKVLQEQERLMEEILNCTPAKLVYAAQVAREYVDVQSQMVASLNVFCSTWVVRGDTIESKLAELCAH